MHQPPWKSHQVNRRVSGHGRLQRSKRSKHQRLALFAILDPVCCPSCVCSAMECLQRNTMPMLFGTQAMAFGAAVWSDLIITVWFIRTDAITADRCGVNGSKHSANPEAHKLVPRDEQHWYKSLSKHLNFVSTSGLEVAISTSAISQKAAFLKKKLTSNTALNVMILDISV